MESLISRIKSVAKLAEQSKERKAAFEVLETLAAELERRQTMKVIDDMSQMVVKKLAPKENEPLPSDVVITKMSREEIDKYLIERYGKKVRL